MQLLFICLGLVGIGMTALGIKWVYKSNFSKTIVRFPISKLTQEFRIETPGLYSINIVGGGSVRNKGHFKMRIVDVKNGHNITIKDNFIKPRMRLDWKMAVELSQFEIYDPGHYRIDIEGLDGLVVKKSMLFVKNRFHSPEDLKNIEVWIKETISNLQKVLGIIFLVFGANLSIWGILLGIYPEAFG